MNGALTSVRNWVDELAGVWNRFWFNPAQPHTLAAIRVLAGAMIFYTHLVWSLNLMSFLGPDSWITGDVAREIHATRADSLGGTSFAWSYLWYIDSPAVLWTLHIIALVIMAMFTLGLFSRVTAVLTFLITVAYCNRLEGALFGLDQVNTMLAMYLMLGPCGAVYSLDRWLARRRKGEALAPPQATVSANIAIRLIQLHMCLIYLFGGCHKMRGITWWDGQATWLTMANYEYQTIDVTWLGHWPMLLAFLTHVTIYWETFYCVLVWHRLSRPIILVLAVAVHGFIASCLGMITFGVVMLLGNLAFVPPQIVRKAVDVICLRRGRAGVGEMSNS